MKNFALASAVVLTGFGFGCNTGELSSEDKDNIMFGKKIEKEIEDSRNPFAQLTKIRKYAIEKLDDETDKESDIINKQKPKISANYENTEYSFVWKVGDNYMIEVVTTPAPFEPIAVYRVKRVFYP